MCLGENHIIIVAGANGLLQEEDVERASPLLYLAKVILLQFETPLKTTEYLLKKFSKENSKRNNIIRICFYRTKIVSLLS